MRTENGVKYCHFAPMMMKCFNGMP